MLDYLPICYAHDVHSHGLHPSASTSDAHKLSLVGTAQEPTEGQLVPLLHAVCLGHAQVRESLTHRGQPPTDELGGRNLLCKRVVADPRLVDLTAGDATELDAAHRRLVAGGWKTQELASVCTSHRQAGNDLVFFSELI